LAGDLHREPLGKDEILGEIGRAEVDGAPIVPPSWGRLEKQGTTATVLFHHEYTHRAYKVAEC